MLALHGEMWPPLGWNGKPRSLFSARAPNLLRLQQLPGFTVRHGMFWRTFCVQNIWDEFPASLHNCTLFGRVKESSNAFWRCTLTWSRGVENCRKSFAHFLISAPRSHPLMKGQVLCVACESSATLHSA